MKSSKPNIVAIDGAYRNHPLPGNYGIKLVSWADSAALESADIFIQNNILEQKRINKVGHIYRYIRNSGKPFIVAESAVFRKNLPSVWNAPKMYHRYSWWSYFRDEGEYNNFNCPDDRWKQIQKDQNIEIKDWSLSGDAILLILQRPGDSSLKNLIAKYSSYENFLIQTISQIRKYTDRKIIIRLHPLRQDRQLGAIQQCNLGDYELSTNNTNAGLLNGGDGLYEDFKRSRVVIGFNSNALTESVCEGIPTFSLCPSSMAWDVSNTNLAHIENPKLDIDRQQWLNNLGYCQWRIDEIEQGLPIDHLLQLYPKNLINPF